MYIMRIGVDARPLGGKLTGDRTYWRGLIGGLAAIDSINHYTLFLSAPLSVVDELPLPSNFETVVVTAPSERIWSLYTFGRALKKSKIDVAHVQYTVPPFLPCKVVTTVHDISFRLFPEFFSLKDRLLLNFSVPSSIRRADAVITVSQSSRKDILQAYPFLNPEKITATPLSAGQEFSPLSAAEQNTARQHIAESYGLSGDYILSVGVLQPRKNLPMLIDAFIRAKKKANLTHVLAIVGKVGWLSDETQKAIAKAGEDVKMLGYVPDKDLPMLYSCACATAYPSLYEGFGLPVLEAMACGCPVLASNNSSIPEVMGDAGILLPAENSHSWEEALIEIAENEAERSKMCILGVKQASKFSWNNTARQTKAIYEQLQ
jgi:glycosyltransferase involved in cell wall biosynthesis